MVKISRTTPTKSRLRRLRPVMPSTHTMSLRSGTRRAQAIVVPVALAVEEVLTAEKERLQGIINQRDARIAELEGENARLRELANAAAQEQNAVEAEAEEDEEEDTNEQARLELLELVGEDDIRIRYWDRFQMWFSLRNLLYHPQEIRADTELARFWNWLVMESPAVHAVVDEIGRLSQSTERVEEGEFASSSEDDANEADVAEPVLQETVDSDDSDKENVPPISYTTSVRSSPNRDPNPAEPSEDAVSDEYDGSEGDASELVMIEEIDDDDGSDKENAAPRISYFVRHPESHGRKRSRDDDEEGQEEREWKRFHC